MKKISFILSVMMLLSMLHLGSSALTVNGFIYSERDDGTLILSELEYDRARGDIVVPDREAEKSITAVGKNAFSYKQFITSVTLPDSVKEISGGAFYMCVGLGRVDIPYGVESIGDKCFALCEALEEVTIPHSVNSLGDGMFLDCKALKTAYIYSTDGEIGDSFFDGCESLESIYISKGTSKVSESAISSCTSLKDIYCEGAEGEITFEGNVIADNNITVHYSYDYEGFNYVAQSTVVSEEKTPTDAAQDAGNRMELIRNILIGGAAVIAAGAAVVYVIRKKKK